MQNENCTGWNRPECPIPEAFKQKFQCVELDQVLWRILAYLDSKAPPGYALRLPSFCYNGTHSAWFGWGLVALSIFLTPDVKKWLFLCYIGEVEHLPYAVESEEAALDKWLAQVRANHSSVFGLIEDVQRENIEYQNTCDMQTSDSDAESYECL